MITLSNEVITINTILNYIEEIRDYLNTLEFQTSSSPYFVKIIYRTIKKFLNHFGFELKFTRFTEYKEFYYFSYSEKNWSLSFLNYCFTHPDNIIDLSLFKNKEDKKEMIKFIRNKVYAALLEKIEKNKLFDEEDLKYQNEYKKMERRIKRKDKNYVLQLNDEKYILPINNFLIEVFYHKYGISEIPDYIRKSLSGKDFIDAGAYIGDSALILNELNPRRIYAFEPVKENISLLRQTIRLNNINNVVIVDKALSSKEGISFIVPVGCGSFISENFMHKKRERIELTTIDKFVNDNSLDVGLIKMDIEGHELEAIKGAKNTIINKKPVLMISLYHTGDAFEIPKLLKSWVPEYEFRFLNLNRANVIFDRILLAYVP
ncbi:MAG: FkbM family methyltransferase [Candidatus Verstraetearchaeota archaeon]|nr:FkbM family methyltransferase [Candidatus Verstraetearchaeota archaeon]